MSQVQVAKLVTYHDIAPDPDSVVVTKMATYFLLEPGDGGGGDVATRQGYAYAQKIRRG